jgi:hypothetical protein
MSDRDLVRRVRDIADTLERAAEWQGTSIEVDGDKDDFVFELLCYASAALAATGHFKVTLIMRPHPRSKKLVPLFPRKPGLKKNFSLSLLKNSGSQIEFQLCPGIFVEDRHGKKRAPDFNLLGADAADDPSHLHLHAMWDAKYVRDESKRLADTAVTDFVVTFEELGSPTPPLNWTNIIGMQPHHQWPSLYRETGNAQTAQSLRDQRLSKEVVHPTMKSWDMLKAAAGGPPALIGRCDRLSGATDLVTVHL